MGDSFDSIINGAHDMLDKIENSGIADSLGGGNPMVDPAPEMNTIIARIFAAIIEVFSAFRNMFKIA